MWKRWERSKVAKYFFLWNLCDRLSVKFFQENMTITENR